ncbi:MAG: GNAT family N-acetyltransferase [Acidimicrobiales bacterium]
MLGEPNSEPNWPLFELRLTINDTLLRPVRETDLDELARILPDDVEHNPNSRLWLGLDLASNRRRLLFQNYWRNWGTWTVESWTLDFCVINRSQIVGIQTLEAEDFVELRTVDSSSWLTPECRGLGLGTAMRVAILGFAFDHLGAQAAITSARIDNAASLGVSRRIGYRENGVTTSRSPTGPCQLQHLRLTRAQWQESSLGNSVFVTGLSGCALYFGLER